jgi:hypothetical protein
MLSDCVSVASGERQARAGVVARVGAKRRAIQRVGLLATTRLRLTVPFS